MGEQKLSQSEKTTIIIAIISALGTIAAAYFTFRSSLAPTELSLHATQTAENRSLPFTSTAAMTPSSIDNTATPTFVTNTATPTLPGNPLTVTLLPTIQPTVQIISAAPIAQQQAIQLSAPGILQLAKQLPLIMRDTFDTNDYGWSEKHSTVDQGIECTTSLKENKYSIFLKSTSQIGSWCLSDVPKSAKDFYLSLETELLENHNTDILLYYRYIDGNNFNYLVLNQEAQALTMAVRQDGKDHILLQSAFIPSILKDKMNKLTLVISGGNHTLFINDHLEVLVSNENTFGQGQVRLGLRLNAANQTQDFLIDNFELRGQ